MVDEPGQLKRSELFRLYKQWGATCFPANAQSKKSIIPSWTKLSAKEGFERFTSSEQNICMGLGRQSRGIVDIDLDCDEAVKLADYFLPATAVNYGRDSSPRSHRFYQVATPGKTQKFTDPSRSGKGAMICEYRSTGSYSIVPGSTHPSGESVKFDTDPEKGPTSASCDVLLTGLRRISAAVVLVRQWNKGQRHEIAVCLAGALLRNHWTEADTENFINAIANAANDEEIEDRLRAVETTNQNLAEGKNATGLPSLERLIGAAVVQRIADLLELSNLEEKAADFGKFPILSIRELEKLPPLSWLVEGHFPKGGLATIYGEPGSGKSFLALDIGLSIGAGRAWNKKASKQGKALYVCAEGAAGIRQRIAAWQTYHGEDQIPDFFVLPMPVQVRSAAEISDLMEAIRNRAGLHRPELIIIDTLARCFEGGDENSSKEIGELIAGAATLQREFDALVILVHHSGKDVRRGERGSTALRGAVDTSINVKRDGSLVTVKNTKQKDAEPFNDIRLVLSQVQPNWGTTSCVLIPVESELASLEQSNVLSPRHEKILKALEQEGRDGRWHFSPKELRERIRIATSTLEADLRTLVSKGKIEKVGRGQYRLPKCSQWSLDLVLDMRLKDVPHMRGAA